MPKKIPIANIYWTNTAEQDLTEIINFLLNKKEALTAKRIYKGIKNAILSLKNFPQKGRIAPDLQEFNIIIYREIIFKNWRIFYKIQDNQIFIMGIIDGRRNVSDLLLHRFLRNI